MKKIYIFLTLAFLNIFLGNAQTADLRLVPVVNCTTNKLEVMIQAKAQAGTFKIGTSSILLNYNTAALSFASYQSESFDKNDLCISGTATSWDDHVFDATTAGTFNVTMTLLSNTFSCPDLSTAWLDVGKITFNITSLAANPQLVFDVANTNFNSVPANDGSNPITKGVFTGFSPAALSCPNTCGVNAGADRVTCAKDTINVSAAPSGQTWSFLDGPATATISSMGAIAGMTTAGTYRFVLANASTCKDTLSVSRAALSVSTSARSFCAGGSSTLSVSGITAGSTYEWLPGGQTTPSISVTTAGTYTLNITGPTGCKQQFVWNITVNPTPVANVTGSLLICPGGTTTLTASGGGTYEWKNPATTVISTAASSGVISSAGVYSVLVTSAANCGIQINATVSLAAKPNAGKDTTICEPATSVQLATIINGASWSSAASNPAGVAIGSISGLATGLTATGTYQFIITNTTSGCKDTLVVTKTTKPNAGADQIICGTQTTAKLAAAAAGQSWRSIVPPNAAGVSINASGNVAGLTTNTIYFFELSSGACKDTVSISRYPAPNAGKDSVLCSPATSIQLLQITSGASWSADPSNPAPATIGTTSGLASGLTINGTYRFIFTNSSVGCKDTIAITRLDKPNAGPDIRICSGTTSKLPAAPSGATWQARTPNPAVATVDASGNVAGMSVVGNYRFYLVAGACSDTVNITKSTKPEVGGDTTLCSPATTIQLATITSGATWSSQTANPAGAAIGSTSGLATGLTSNGLYQFIFTNTSNTCSDTVRVTKIDKPNAGSDIKICGTATTTQLTASPASGTWSQLATNPAGASVSASGAVTGLTTGTFRFIYKTGTCSDTVKVEKFSKPNAGTDLEVCLPASTASLGAVTGAGAWSAAAGNPATAVIGTTSGEVTGMTSLGTYQFIFSNTSTGCSDTMAIVVKNCACIKPIIATTNPAAICSPNTVSLTSSVTGCTGTLTFFTDMSGTNPLTGSTVSSSGTYYAKCTVAGCDSDLKPIVVTINPLPTVPTLTGGGGICAGQSATISLTGCTGTIAWYNGTTVIAGQTAATYSATAAGSYSATCSNSCGESAKSTAIVVTTGAAPAAPVLTGGGGICAGQSATISLTGCTGTIAWYNGTTVIAGQTAATYSATAAGSYSATCSNSCGESAKSTAIVVTVGTTPTTPAAVSRTNVCPATTINLSDLITATSELYTDAARATMPLSVSAVSAVSVNATYYLFNKSTTGCYSASAVVTATINTCQQAPASIGNLVWNDLNQNGVQNVGEPGISGVKVYLVNVATSASTSVFTDGNGKYSFTGLVPGDYSLVFNTPIGYVATAKNVGGDPTKDSDADVIAGTTIVTNLVAAENDSTWDAGFYMPTPKGTIGNYVFNDTNNNGTQDAGDTPVGGVKIYLLNSVGLRIDSTYSNLDGSYLFNVVSGTYSLQFMAPSGRTFTTPNVGDDTKDSDAGLNGQTANVTIDTTKPVGDAARTITHIDAGLNVAIDCVPSCIPISVRRF
jgi:SdrD B-like domain